LKTIGIIFARGGSKGLPGKNIRSFNGKPLIAWSIEQAKAVKEIDRVIVSTDSNEIAKIAKKYGAEVPFIRPAELAQDNSSEWLAWQHAINFLKSEETSPPELMVSIPTTSPLRDSKDIQDCLFKYQENNFDTIITITDTNRSPYFNMVKVNIDGSVELVNKPKKTIINRQSVPEVFDITTVCYVVRTEFILNNNSIFDGVIGAVHIPPERSIDIDTLLDFQVAECIYKLKNN
jgi:N-acylneuraminate cytidylyltransferase